MAHTDNQVLLGWVEDMVGLTKPDKVVWIDGSEEQLEELRKDGMATGEMVKLNQEKLPGCYYHRSAQNDVARVEDRTGRRTPVQPTTGWIPPPCTQSCSPSTTAA